MKIRQCKSIEELQKLTIGHYIEGYILLNGGLRSSKVIEWLPEDNVWWICNFIDDSEEYTSDDELRNSFLGKAIKQGAFYIYGD